MNGQQLDIMRTVIAVVFALIGIILVVLGVKEAGSKKKKWGLFIFGGMSLSFSIFAASLLVESAGLRDILTSIAVLSALVSNAFVIAFVIGEYRHTR
jgi:uncharacterized membrane protein